MAEEVKPASAAGSGTVAPVAAANPVAQPGPVAAPVSAATSVPKFGGNRGGKARADGLAPGSAAAKEADRKKDAERKRQARVEAARVAEPPPLPSAVASAPGAAQAPGGGPGPDVVAPGVEPAIPWDPELLKPLIAEAVEFTEKRRVQNFKEAAEEARLGESLVKQIASDARYIPAFKQTFTLTAPRAVAKLLNRTGISGKWTDEALSTVSLLALWVQGMRLQAQLEELVKTAKKNEQAKQTTTQQTEAPKANA